MTTQTEQAKATKIAGETTKGTWVTTHIPEHLHHLPRSRKEGKGQRTHKTSFS